MKKKRFLFSLSIFIISFIIADIAFSNFIFDYRVGYKCYNHSEDGSFYELDKNCYAKMRLVSSIDSFEVYTNNDGERYSGKKKEKKFTNNEAYFFGDSFTFGAGSDWENTFVGIIDNKINNYKIYNFAVPSYSPTVHYYKLKKILKEKNDISKKIFIQLDLTDVGDESERWKAENDHSKPFLKNKDVKKKISNFKKIRRKNFKGSRLIANYLREFSRKIRKTLVSENEKKNQYKPVNGNPSGGFIYTNFEELTGCKTKEKKTSFWTCGGVDKGLKKIEERLKKIGDLSNSINAELYIIIFPWPDTLNFGQINFNWEQYSDHLCKISKCKNVINLFPEFLEIKKNKNDWLEYLYLHNDIHLTPEANKITANKILKIGFNHID
jgi:hypothetical protein